VISLKYQSRSVNTGKRIYVFEHEGRFFLLFENGKELRPIGVNDKPEQDMLLEMNRMVGLA
jgi:hypothetical protein